MIRHIRENGRRRGAGLVLTLALATGIVGTWTTDAHALSYAFAGTTQLAHKTTVRDISCTTDGACVVVGDDMARILIGNSTTPISGLNGPGQVVSHRDQNSWVSVSCVSTGACMMTGLGDGNTGDSAFRASFTAAWTRAAFPIPAAIRAQGGGFSFQSLSCVSATFCVEVGTVLTETGTLSAEWRWDGKAWHVGALNPEPGGLIHLRAVSCWSAFECLVVGDDEYSTPIRWRLDGSTWHRANLPHPGGAANGDVLPEAISCWSADHCTIIGSHAAQGVSGMFVWQWAGGSFAETTVTSPRITDATFLSLSCTTANFCVAAGPRGGESSDPLLGATGTYVLLWDGATWIKPSFHVTNVGASRTSVALAASCTALITCQLVGYDYTNTQPVMASSFLDSLKVS
jgi:hypothetical protein